MILFRGKNKAQDLPPWLTGKTDLYRIPDIECGDILCSVEPFLVPPAASCRWLDIGDGWQVAQAGKDAQVNHWLRGGPDMTMHRVTDARGRVWLAPQILTADGVPALSMAWGKNPDGVRVRKPTDEQAKMLAAAQAARAEVLANALGIVPIDVLASWVYPLLEAVYHLTADVFDALGLVDDTLGVLAVLAATGFPKPQAVADAV